MNCRLSARRLRSSRRSLLYLRRERLHLNTRSKHSGSYAAPASATEMELVFLPRLSAISAPRTVVGEDLGTVPEGFRERMAEANILSYRVLFFEQEPGTGAFLPPSAYPTLALAVVGSH